MEQRILVSGERDNFTTLAFNSDQRRLSILANYEAPYNASWVELSSSEGGTDHLIGLSEGFESGLLYTFEIDHIEKTCKITSKQETLGAPAHCKSAPSTVIISHSISYLCGCSSHSLTR